jgi:hypothetical protein
VPVVLLISKIYCPKSKIEYYLIKILFILIQKKPLENIKRFHPRI